MTARVDRDGSTGKITGLSDLVVVGDLYSLGLPDPTVPTSKGFIGDVDYSPDGSSIVASIRYDLWLVHLSSGNTNRGGRPPYREHRWLRRVETRVLAGRHSYCLHRRSDFYLYGWSVDNGHLFAGLGHACRDAGYHEQEQGQSGFGAPQRDVAVRRYGDRLLGFYVYSAVLALLHPALTASSS